MKCLLWIYNYLAYYLRLQQIVSCFGKRGFSSLGSRWHWLFCALFFPAGFVVRTSPDLKISYTYVVDKGIKWIWYFIQKIGSLGARRLHAITNSSEISASVSCFLGRTELEG